MNFFSWSIFSPKIHKHQVSVLLVCTANYCRSPMAEGILRQQLSEKGLSQSVRIDSAGTHVSRNGQAPDIRAQQTVSASGVQIAKLRSRSIKPIDFVEFDYIIAMDTNNYRSLLSLCPDEYQQKIMMIMSFAPQFGVTEVPDPYYSNKAGFKQVYTFLEQAIAGLVKSIEQKHGLS